MSIPIGTAIYISVKPLFKIFLNCALGFVLAKKKILTVETCQHISLILINFFMPCLIFYNIVSCLDGSEIKVIGVVSLTAFLYTAIGLFFGMVVWYSTPNPRKWFGGVIAAGGFNNCSDLPIAYITTLASGSLFPAGSSQQGTAYAVIFAVVFIICVFNLGGFSLIAHDFKYKVDDPESQGTTVPVISVGGIRRGVGRFRDWRRRRGEGQREANEQDIDLNNITSNDTVSNEVHYEDYENAIESDNESIASPQPYIPEIDNEKLQKQKTKQSESLIRILSTPESSRELNPIYLENRSDSISVAPGAATTLGYRRTRNSIMSGTASDIRPIVSVPNAGRRRPETLDDVILSYSAVRELATLGGTEEPRPTSSRQLAPPPIHEAEEESSSKSLQTESNNTTQTIPRSRKRSKAYAYFIVFLKNLLRPPSMALFVSLAVTMAPPLRRLFYIDPTNTNKNQYNIPVAPDNQPVLDFVMDFASFVGNACVPLGLSMLGATIARLKLGQFPKGFWKSIALTCIFKLVVLPIISILWVNKLMALKWIDESNTMAAFVMIITSAVPTATSQLYITAMFTPPGDEHIQMDCLAAYLICQYSLLVLTLSILVTYTLKNVVSV